MEMSPLQDNAPGGEPVFTALSKGSGKKREKKRHAQLPSAHHSPGGTVRRIKVVEFD